MCLREVPCTDFIIPFFGRLFKEICAESSLASDIEFFSDGSWHSINSRDGKLGNDNEIGGAHIPPMATGFKNE